MAAMAKKKQSKKHKFKYTEPVMGMGGGATVYEASRPGDLRAPQTRAAAGNHRDYSYVGSDMRRIVVLAGTLVGVELAIYYLVSHSALGITLSHLV
jgi:hypothetical protein